jgi:DegV family protein with EDD domain
MNIAVVTDSTSDLPRDIAARYEIVVVPNVLTMNNVSYSDGEGFSREDFYSNIHHLHHPPTTAAPSPEVYAKVYQGLLDRGAELIFSIHPARELSALCDVATIGASQFGDKVEVVDSSNVSLGLGFQALNIARAAARGENRSQILAMLDHIRDRIRVFAYLDTLAFVRHSGRVHWVTSSLANMLGLKAVIEIRRGVVHRAGLSRSRQQGIELLKKVAAGTGSIYEAAILHTTPLAENDLSSLMQIFPPTPEPVMIVPVNPILGSHVGPGCVGVGLVLN